ncbi:hypothetical protein INT45_007359 [Circinella minor]|uniref:Uncharacterized protein n=1 Tax=Circinella minor TaxID=1195481 RepID=A0A8H7VJ22_9FUNG|nr:hypothetical protein INT45_007359 [Circinella minor]
MYNILSRAFSILWTNIKNGINGISFDDSNNDDDVAVEARRNVDEIEQAEAQEDCYSSESEGDQNTNFEC